GVRSGGRNPAGGSASRLRSVLPRRTDGAQGGRHGHGPPDRTRTASGRERPDFRRKPPRGRREDHAGRPRANTDDSTESGGLMTQQKRVLLVDDEVSIQRSLSSLLRSRGYAVDIAPSGESALKAISDRPPDLVLLDLGLPLLDGGEVCRRVRDVSPVPIIILTARNNET